MTVEGEGETIAAVAAIDTAASAAATATDAKSTSSVAVDLALEARETATEAGEAAELAATTIEELLALCQAQTAKLMRMELDLVTLQSEVNRLGQLIPPALQAAVEASAEVAEEVATATAESILTDTAPSESSEKDASPMALPDGEAPTEREEETQQDSRPGKRRWLAERRERGRLDL